MSEPLAQSPEPPFFTAAEGTAGQGVAHEAGDEGAADPALPAQPDEQRSGQNTEQRSTPHNPGFIFFGILASVVLSLDVASKSWAEFELSRR
ncbi:MAG TPA: hypothetical protein VL137_17415, partial [Polyangiaceae bacterium]|nr:hypothetical protein [Polyangiaceae bacterium]